MLAQLDFGKAPDRGHRHLSSNAIGPWSWCLLGPIDCHLVYQVGSLGNRGLFVGRRVPRGYDEIEFSASTDLWVFSILHCLEGEAAHRFVAELRLAVRPAVPDIKKVTIIDGAHRQVLPGVGALMEGKYLIAICLFEPLHKREKGKAVGAF